MPRPVDKEKNVEENRFERDYMTATSLFSNTTLLVRLYLGVANHFTIRWTEWAMLWPTFGMWMALQFDPDMFSKSPSFSIVSRWGSEGQWSLIFGIAMTCRFAALVINGTFKGFAFSPHIRACASLIGILIWSQISLGFLQAFVSEGGALSGFILYSLPVLLELMNAWRSWLDVGREYPKEN